MNKLQIDSLDQLVEYFSLVGDASDGLPGVKGIGAKTASILLKKYSTFEAILKASCLSNSLDKTLVKVRED